jgi:hypothetical protein
MFIEVKLMKCVGVAAPSPPLLVFFTNKRTHVNNQSLSTPTLIHA